VAPADPRPKNLTQDHQISAHKVSNEAVTARRAAPPITPKKRFAAPPDIQVGGRGRSVFQTDRAQTGSWGDQGDGTYRNPILNADYPDVDVEQLGDTYYMISSKQHMAPGMVILESKDMVNWCTIGHVWGRRCPGPGIQLGGPDPKLWRYCSRALGSMQPWNIQHGMSNDEGRHEDVDW